MLTIIMLTAAGVSAVFALEYWISGLSCKKNGKDKKTISEELIEFLKE